MWGLSVCASVGRSRGHKVRPPSLPPSVRRVVRSRSTEEGREGTRKFFWGKRVGSREEESGEGDRYHFLRACRERERCAKQVQSFYATLTDHKHRVGGGDDFRLVMRLRE